MENIHAHHNEEEIQLVIFQRDTKYWIEELHFISDELTFYRELLNSPKMKDTTGRELSLKRQVRVLIKNNDILLKNCYHSQNQLEGYQECDQMHCDYIFLQMHLKYRTSIEKHFKRVRSLKYLVMDYLKENIAPRRVIPI